MNSKSYSDRPYLQSRVERAAGELAAASGDRRKGSEWRDSLEETVYISTCRWLVVGTVAGLLRRKLDLYGFTRRNYSRSCFSRRKTRYLLLGNRGWFWALSSSSHLGRKSDLHGFTWRNYSRPCFSRRKKRYLQGLGWRASPHCGWCRRAGLYRASTGWLAPRSRQGAKLCPCTLKGLLMKF